MAWGAQNYARGVLQLNLDFSLDRPAMCSYFVLVLLAL